ncbi:MAG: pectate lyase [Pirellulales bacterium]
MDRRTHSDAQQPEKVGKLRTGHSRAHATLDSERKVAWNEYLKRSHAAALRGDLAWQEVTQAGSAQALAAPGNRKEFELGSKVDAAWLDKAIQEKLPETIISYQTPTGGWSKAVDYSAGPRKLGMHWTSQSGKGWHYCGTLDNRSTTEQIRFLSMIVTHTNHVDCREAAVRGIRWLLDAQFPSGGWPQVYPLESGYHEAITLNDGAMQHALELLIEIRSGEAPFAWTKEDLREEAARAVERGLSCIFDSQIKIGDRTTVWCAQHGPITLAPVSARKKEPPSLSGGESAELVKFLMRTAPDSPRARNSIESATTWFRSHVIVGKQLTKNAEGKSELVDADDKEAQLWARFYDLETEQPIFAGAQDGIVYDSFNEMAKHNKIAYDYFVTRPKEVIGKEYDRWKKRINKK